MADQKKILVIEDEEDIGKTLSYRLNRLGFETFVANDGLQGLEKARSWLPDLIILDLTLPTLSGEEICKSLREDYDDRLSSLPIIMLTAKSSEVDRIVGKVIGASAYMTKPFQTEKLLEKIDDLIGIPQGTND